VLILIFILIHLWKQIYS